MPRPTLDPRRRSIANESPKPGDTFKSWIGRGSSWQGELSEDFDEDDIDTDVYCQVEGRGGDGGMGRLEGLHAL